MQLRQMTCDLQINPLQPSAYRFNGISGFGASPDPGLGGVTAGASIRHYPSPLGDLNQRRDVGPGISPDVLDISNEIPNSSNKVDGLPVSAREPNFLFVDKLPTDCTRREVGRILFLCIVFAYIIVVYGIFYVALYYIELLQQKGSRSFSEMRFSLSYPLKA